MSVNELICLASSSMKSFFQFLMHNFHTKYDNSPCWRNHVNFIIINFLMKITIVFKLCQSSGTEPVKLQMTIGLYFLGQNNLVISIAENDEESINFDLHRHFPVQQLLTVICLIGKETLCSENDSNFATSCSSIILR